MDCLNCYMAHPVFQQNWLETQGTHPYKSNIALVASTSKVVLLVEPSIFSSQTLSAAITKQSGFVKNTRTRKTLYKCCSTNILVAVSINASLNGICTSLNDRIRLKVISKYSQLQLAHWAKVTVDETQKPLRVTQALRTGFPTH